MAGDDLAWLNAPPSQPDDPDAFSARFKPLIRALSVSEATTVNKVQAKVRGRYESVSRELGILAAAGGLKRELVMNRRGQKAARYRLFKNAWDLIDELGKRPADDMHGGLFGKLIVGQKREWYLITDALHDVVSIIVQSVDEALRLSQGARKSADKQLWNTRCATMERYMSLSEIDLQLLLGVLQNVPRRSGEDKRFTPKRGKSRPRARTQTKISAPRPRSGR
ncbi:MAG: hypothetical protein ACYDDF_08855 [Thermoplasmatota archaeon]